MFPKISWTMPNDNRRMNKAGVEKKYEFYTQLPDIENELRHYKSHFRGKTVFCNCDDPRVSNFFRYFTLNFEALGLKKVIATCYKNCEPDLFSTNKDTHSIYIIYEGDKNGNRIPDPEEMEVMDLKGDGDFRSAECIELLKEADIVCTNPPFGLFREYVHQLIEYDKKFLIIGNQNAIKYKEIFRLFKEGKIWLGYGFKRNCAHFYTPYKDTASDADHREGMIRVSGVMWFTNLEISKRHEDMILVKKYNPEEYKEYDNYHAINVELTKDIPMDYDGYMGVPLTFMTKYCPEQFDLIWVTDRGGDGQLDFLKKPNGRKDAPTIDGEGHYTRIIIKRK